jgi:hypothetical protein
MTMYLNTFTAKATMVFCAANMARASKEKKVSWLSLRLTGRLICSDLIYQLNQKGRCGNADIF